MIVVGTGLLPLAGSAVVRIAPELYYGSNLAAGCGAKLNLVGS
jgi:hypothetical protein